MPQRVFHRLAATLMVTATAVGLSMAALPGTGAVAAPGAVVFDVAYGSNPAQKLDVYPGSQRAPAVILVHGGHWTGGDKAAPSLREVAQSLAADGFAVFNINYRLATSKQDGYPMMTDDIAAAVSWTQANGGEYGADPSDISLLGGSAGGHLVTLAAQLINSEAPGTIRKVVSLSGPMDFVQMEALAGGLARGYDLVYVNTYLGCVLTSCTPAQLQGPSPYYNIERATCPAMMLVHSQRDMIPVVQATRMHDALGAAGCSSTLTVPPGRGHGFEMFEPQHDAITAFLRN